MEMVTQLPTSPPPAKVSFWLLPSGLVPSLSLRIFSTMLVMPDTS